MNRTSEIKHRTTKVGVLGGGQLGRLLELAGYPLGLRFRFLGPAAEAPAGIDAKRSLGSYEEEDLLRVAAEADVVTYESDKVPAAAAAFLARRVPVFPPPRALELKQDRLAEKNFLRGLGIPTADFAAIDNRWESVFTALEELTLPIVLKQRHSGNGGAQRVLHTMAEVEEAWAAFAGIPSILESTVETTRELSLVAVRGRDGEMRFYPLVENRHVDGRLRCSLAPAPDVAPSLQAEAEDDARRIALALDYVGVLVVELFDRGGRLVVKELAPCVHESGHWTIEGAVTSQFENHLRAILGLPLGSTSAIGHSAMVNIIGDVPDLRSILKLPDTHVHLHDASARPERKLGHITSRVHDRQGLEERVRELTDLVAGR